MSTARIATVSFLVDDTPHTIESNLNRAAGYVRHAAEKGADLVLLPEMFRTINVPGRESEGEEGGGRGSFFLREVAAFRPCAGATSPACLVAPCVERRG